MCAQFDVIAAGAEWEHVEDGGNRSDVVTSREVTSRGLVCDGNEEASALVKCGDEAVIERSTSFDSELPHVAADAHTDGGVTRRHRDVELAAVDEVGGALPAIARIATRIRKFLYFTFP